MHCRFVLRLHCPRARLDPRDGERKERQGGEDGHRLNDETRAPSQAAPRRLFAPSMISAAVRSHARAASTASGNDQQVPLM